MGEPQKSSLLSAIAIPLGTVGAILGAFLGGYLFNYLISRGFYMPLLVGGCVGFATAACARRGGLILALIATLVALAATLAAPWLALDLPRPDLQDFITSRFHLSATSIALQLASPVIAFVIVLFTPPKPPKKPPT